MNDTQGIANDQGNDRLEPRERLHARVGKHVRALDELGLAPNRTITLGGTVFHGWLLDDPFAQASSRRWLLLPDGDVWCEAAYLAGPWRQDQSLAYGWLTQPTPALESVLGLSLAEARGGGALLATPGAATATYRVADRRGALGRRSISGRRRGRPAAPGSERRRADRRSRPDRRRQA